MLRREEINFMGETPYWLPRKKIVTVLITEVRKCNSTFPIRQKKIPNFQIPAVLVSNPRHKLPCGTVESGGNSLESEA
jgi:hypothetical protein